MPLSFHLPRWGRIGRTLGLFLAVLGPGIITANADNDAGGIATYSLAGSRYGYTMLWSLIPITLILIVVQEMVARMGAVTGKGLSDLIRENFGVKVTFWVLLGLLIADLGNTVAEFSGIAASGEMVGVSRYVSVPLGALFVWWIILKGSFKPVEKYFLTACVFYVAYLISGFMAHPPWHEVLLATVVPSFSFTPGYLSMFIGVVGTTIAPWMQFYLQSAMVEKRIKPEQYALSRWDVVIGCIVTDVVAFFIIAACAATVYRSGTPVHDVKDVAMALQPLAGTWASALFAFGLFNASLLSACILPLATAYVICEGMGWEAGVDRTFKEAPVFLTLYTILIAISAGVVLFPNAPLLGIMFWSQVANGALLPFVLVAMLELINKPRLMGAHVNGRLYNVLAWGATGIMIALTALLVLTTLFPGLLPGAA